MDSRPLRHLESLYFHTSDVLLSIGISRLSVKDVKDVKGVRYESCLVFFISNFDH